VDVTLIVPPCPPAPPTQLVHVLVCPVPPPPPPYARRLCNNTLLLAPPVEAPIVIVPPAEPDGAVVDATFAPPAPPSPDAFTLPRVMVPREPVPLFAVTVMLALLLTRSANGASTLPPVLVTSRLLELSKVLPARHDILPPATGFSARFI